MEIKEFMEIVHFAENLKNQTRHAWTSSGRHESVAEHSWRLCLMAYFLRDKFPEADMDKVIRMCVFHDIGEAFTGDIPAFEKTRSDSDAEDEVIDRWLAGLPAPYNVELGKLFEEMRKRETLEAKIYKAIDKMEAVIQHNESDIRTWLPLEYDLQLTYGEKEVMFSKVFQELKEAANEETREKIVKAETMGYVKENENPLLSADENMGVIRLVLGACFTNCYLVYSKKTKECMIIDPADCVDEIMKSIETNHLKPVYIVITHGHTDHILAVGELKAQYHIPIFISKTDAWRLGDEALINERPYVNTPYKAVKPSVLLQENDEIRLDDICFRVMVVPGHTEGSILLITNHAIFTGDTMLKGGHGKTSLPGGNDEDMKASLRRIKELDGDYIIYPGHKEITTLEEERKHE